MFLTRKHGDIGRCVIRILREADPVSSLYYQSPTCHRVVGVLLVKEKLRRPLLKGNQRKTSNNALRGTEMHFPKVKGSNSIQLLIRKYILRQSTFTGA